ncbi:MAG: RNA 2',3'-cyclic phosphodiesterase [Tepidisphaeraceae bacterium]|jgi:2'-5' RNA ligase
MRLFIAIELPDDVRRHLQKMQDLLQPILKAKWTRPEQLHLTLKFLGEADDSKLPEIIGQLRAINISDPIRLATAGVLCLPPHGPIRIVAAALADEGGNCAKLQAEIDQVCYVAGFPLEGRRWTPHVTLARVKDRVGASARAQAEIACAKIPAAAFEAGGFSLIESRLDRTGPAYATVATFTDEARRRA